MKARLLISVIVPVFNVKPYLAEAIESVINQTYKDLEIILIDDGSTDGSGDLCDEYSKKDERIIVIHQDNKGLSATRNRGLDVMSGDAVAFLDSDDAYHPDFVRLMVNTMIFQSADMVVCKYTGIKSEGILKRRNDEKGYPLIEAGTYNRGDILRALADNVVNQSVWNKLYKRELWNDIRYPEGHVYEDRCTSFRIMNLCNKVCVVNDVLYFHIVRPGSITDTYSQKNISDWLFSFEIFNEFIESNIPEIYNNHHLRKSRQSQLDVMINGYYRICGTTKQYRKTLRHQIIELAQKSGDEMLSNGIRIKYFFILYCPFVVAPYSKMYSLIRYIKGRL